MLRGRRRRGSSGKGASCSPHHHRRLGEEIGEKGAPSKTEDRPRSRALGGKKKGSMKAHGKKMVETHSLTGGPSFIIEAWTRELPSPWEEDLSTGLRGVRRSRKNPPSRCGGKRKKGEVGHRLEEKKTLRAKRQEGKENRGPPVLCRASKKRGGGRHTRRISSTGMEAHRRKASRAAAERVSGGS